MAFKSLEWDEAFEDKYSSEMREHLPAIKSECLSGIGKIWESENGVFILGADSDELVVMFMSGKNMIDEMKEILSYAEQNFKSIRVSSYRKGMEKFVKQFGLERREIILGRVF